MTEYQIQPHTRRCAVTGRDLQPGERYFTALLEEADHFLRHDYSCEAWQGPPPGTFSFWAGRVPPPEVAARPKFDAEMLMDCFLRLENQTDDSRVNFRYVLGLLLMRQKRLKFEQAITEGDSEKICLRCVHTGTKHQVTNPRLSEEQLSQVQEEVFKVLGWE